MNIFVTDPDPIKSAVVLPDKHIVKMPLETCQMPLFVLTSGVMGLVLFLSLTGHLITDKVPSVTTPDGLG